MAKKNSSERKSQLVNGYRVTKAVCGSGLTRAEICRDAHVSTNTLHGMEKGEITRTSSIRAIERFLKQDEGHFTTFDAPVSQGPKKRFVLIDDYKEDRVDVKAIFGGLTIDEAELLKVGIRKLKEAFAKAKCQDGFDPQKVVVSFGSLIVTVPLSRRDSLLLVSAFLAGALEDLQVISVSILASHFEQNTEDQAGTIESEPKAVACDDAKSILTSKTFVDESRLGVDLALLPAALDLNRRWRDGDEGGQRLELPNTNLRQANLIRADLREVNLSGADLRGAKLSEADLRGADLRATDFSGADLSGAKLSEADLRGAKLSETDLRVADLRETDFSGADLSGARLSGADLSGAKLSWANLYRAILMTSNLSRADMSEACLNLADLSSANLSGADLRATDFSGADLSGAKLSGANLRGGKLSEARFVGTDMAGADLRGADLRGANLSGANLFRADLMSANVIGATIEPANYAGAAKITVGGAKITDTLIVTFLYFRLLIAECWQALFRRHGRKATYDNLIPRKPGNQEGSGKANATQD